jgi:mono/diheme cytochrome c family protein
MRYVLLLLAVLVLGGTGGFVWFAWHGSIAPIAPPARAAFDPTAIARGARLAALGDCISCHTVPGGTPFAGGRAIQTPFGTIYASNITPDRETGIGTWSEAAFRRAMREGVDRGGHQLYPAFPYDHFTRVSDADDADLHAYLMTREPAQATIPPNDLSFPLDIRALIAGWKLLFFRPAPFHPDSTQSEAWNRGAYLVQGLAHCGACHTPRNFLGAEKAGQRFDGGEVQGWYADPLSVASLAPEPWTEDTLYAYLRHGWQAQHGVALGPMGEVTHDLAGVPDDDLRAIATYVASLTGTLPPRPAPPPAAASPPAASLSATSLSAASPPAGPGEALYRGACASCHDGGRGPPFGGIDLALSSILHAPNPTDLANIVVGGIPATGEERAPIMPGFGAVLTDRQMLDLLTWLRVRFGGAPPWDGIPGAIHAARNATALREAAR